MKRTRLKLHSFATYFYDQLTISMHYFIYLVVYFSSNCLSSSWYLFLKRKENRNDIFPCLWQIYRTDTTMGKSYRYIPFLNQVVIFQFHYQVKLHINLFWQQNTRTQFYWRNLKFAKRHASWLVLYNILTLLNLSGVQYRCTTIMS